MAMNSHNTNQITSNELEAMMQLADLYQAGMKMDEAILAVEHSSPACKKYMQDVAYFCKMYSGGESFPLLQCLDSFCNLAFFHYVWPTPLWFWKYFLCGKSMFETSSAAVR